MPSAEDESTNTSIVIPNLSQHIFENNKRIQDICSRGQHLESELQEPR